MRKLYVVVTALITICACGGTGSSTPASTPTASRPSTPVKIAIVSPTNGEVVHGTSVNVVVSITGGSIDPNTTTNISPTKGHIHLYLQHQLIFMAYKLTQAVAVQPGVTYSLYAEFVASDHSPFNPRDQTPTIVFTVAPS